MKNANFPPNFFLKVAFEKATYIIITGGLEILYTQVLKCHARKISANELEFFI